MNNDPNEHLHRDRNNVTVQDAGLPNNSNASTNTGLDTSWMSGVIDGSCARHNRIRSLPLRHGEWTCFMCLHIRTGSILIGFWYMFLDLLALSLTTVAVIHPELFNQASGTFNTPFVPQLDVQSVNCTKMPCLLATKRNSEQQLNFALVFQNLFSTLRLNNDNLNVALFITLCLFMVTLIFVYGAFRGQPSHLVPFFFLQVFEFCVSSMTMISYLSYLPNVRQMLLENPLFPFQQQLLEMNTNCLTLFVMLIFLVAFMVKAYCISIVWRCYKYLMLRAAQGDRWVLGSTMDPVDQESQTLVLGHDLPDYNTAINDPQYRKKISSLFPDPPPSYDMAMAAQEAAGQRDRSYGDTAVPAITPLLRPLANRTENTESDNDSPDGFSNVNQSVATTSTANARDI